MKSIKFLIIQIISLLIFSCTNAQTNELTSSEFSEIKINNIRLLDIISTKGSESSLTALLGNIFTVETGDEPDYWVKFSSNMYNLLFQDGVQSVNGIENYQLTDLWIVDESTELYIKNINLTIGDNINLLGSPNILTYSNGIKEIVFKLGVQVIEIRFDSSTNLIIQIKYKCYTT